MTTVPGSVLHQRSPGLHTSSVALRATVAVVALVLALALGPTGTGPTALWVVVGVVGVLLLVVGVGKPLLHWWKVDLVVDESGVRFGARGASPDEVGNDPGSVGRATRVPLFAPYPAIRQAWVVTADATRRELVRRATTPGGRYGQVSFAWGFYPSPTAPGHLVLAVDQARVAFPPPRRRPPTGRLLASPVALEPSRLWVFPVHDVDAVVGALAMHGVVASPPGGDALPGLADLP